MNVFELFASLTLDTSGYDSGLDDAEKEASSFGSTISKGLGTAAKIGGAAIAAVGTAATAATTATVAFGKKSVEVGAEFDKSMSQVAATMGTTTDNIQDLRDFAMEMGSTTAFSATQAADALNYMALAGYDAETSMEMLPTVLNLAAAGSIDLASASDMVTDAQSALGLSTEQAAEMVDQMAQASSRSNTSVEQLGQAFLTVGATAANLQGGTQELATVLGVLADNGIKGAEGGTHLRNILLSLQDAAGESGVISFNNGLEDVNVALYDAEGNMRSTIDVIAEMQKGMADMSQQAKDTMVQGMFNRADLASVNALFATSADRFNELESAIGQANGAAQQMADTQLDNLAGDITIFKSALEGAQIVLSDKLTPTIREFVQFGTDGISSITEGFKEGGLEGAMEALGNTLSTGISKVVENVPTIANAALKLLESLGGAIRDNAPALLGALVDVVSKIMDKLPDLLQIIIDVVVAIANGLSEAIPVLIPAIVTTLMSLVEVILDNADLLIDAAIGLIMALADGIMAALPVLLQKAPEIISKLVAVLFSAFYKLEMAGVELLMALLNGIIDCLPTLMEAIGKLIPDIVIALVEQFPMLIQVGFDALAAIIGGFVDAIPSLIANLIAGVVLLIRAIGETFIEYDWLSLGKNIIQGIIDGVGSMAGAIAQAASNIADSFMSTIKGAFGIHSPSTIMRDEVGKMLALGLGEGFEENEPDLQGMVDDMMVSPSLSLSAAGIGGINLAGSLDGLQVIAPVYIGQTLIDTVISDAITRQEYTSGGR